MQDEKMKNDDVFDSYVVRLIELWINWIQYHELSNDESRSFSERRKSAELCQNLQNDRIDLIDQLDNFIEVTWRFDD